MREGEGERVFVAYGPLGLDLLFCLRLRLRRWRWNRSALLLLLFARVLCGREEAVHEQS